MTAKEWLGVMQQADNYNPAMTSLIIKYGEMLVAESTPLPDTDGKEQDELWDKVYGLFKVNHLTTAKALDLINELKQSYSIGPKV
jgi:hypothetical protein